MDVSDGPLVWIDCEMTGLNPRQDRLLEIAVSVLVKLKRRIHAILLVKVIITNGNLEPIDEGIRYVIHTEKPILDG